MEPTLILKSVKRKSLELESRILLRAKVYVRSYLLVVMCLLFIEVESIVGVALWGHDLLVTIGNDMLVTVWHYSYA